MNRSFLRLLSRSAAALLALSVASLARASPVLDAVGSIGGNAGAQGVVSGPGAASTYFNPALLSDAEESALVGLALASEQIGVTLDGRRGGDVPLVVGERDVLNPDLSPLPNDVVPTPWLRDGCPPGSQAGTCPPPGLAARPRQKKGASQKTRTYLTLGLVKRLAWDRLTLGLYAMIPLGSLTTVSASYPDEREALFGNSLRPELYGDRMTALSLSMGAALKVIPELSVGVGLSVSLANAATSASYVRETTNYDTLLLNNSVSTEVGFSPMAGIRLQPTPRLRVGAAVHAPSSFSLDTSITAALPSGTESGTSRHEVYHWMPWRVSFGAEADVVRHGIHTMSVAASARYAFWSDYEDRHGQSPSIYGPGLSWSNTLSGAVGLRHRAGPLRAFIDFTYTKTPVPLQIGRSNYVDNDRLGLLAGADVELHVGPLHIRPGLQLFAHRLLHRHAKKDDSLIRDELPDGSLIGSTRDPVPGAQGLQTNNPGWPGFASEGWLAGGAFTLSVPL